MKLSFPGKAVVLAVSAVSVVGLAACSSSGGSKNSPSASSGGSSSAGSTAGSAGAGGGTTSLPKKTIGVVVTSLQSESEATFANDTKAAAQVLGWTTKIVDGQNNPQVWAQGAQGLVTQKVDAIITVGIDAPTITATLQAAKSAKIPVIATDVSVAPTGKDLFTAVYSDNDSTLGQALADYAVSKTPGAKAVGQTATAVYAADLLVRSAKTELAAKGGSMEQIQDIDVTNLAGSFAKTAVSLVQGHSDAKYLISCCDFAPSIDLPALQQANLTGVTLLTRYDNASTLKFIAQGQRLAVVAANTERTNLQALDVLAAYFAKKTPIPSTYPGDKFEYKVIDKSNLPSGGEHVYPFAAQLATYTTRWKSLYSNA